MCFEARPGGALSNAGRRGAQEEGSHRRGRGEEGAAQNRPAKLLVTQDLTLGGSESWRARWSSVNSRETRELARLHPVRGQSLGARPGAFFLLLFPDAARRGSVTGVSLQRGLCRKDAIRGGSVTAGTTLGGRVPALLSVFWGAGLALCADAPAQLEAQGTALRLPVSSCAGPHGWSWSHGDHDSAPRGTCLTISGYATFPIRPSVLSPER